MTIISRASKKLKMKIRKLEKNISLCSTDDPRLKQWGPALASAKRSLSELKASRPSPVQTAKPRLTLVKSQFTTPIPKLGEPHPDYVKDEEFYRSIQWRQLRYLALRNCKGCQCCGAKASDGIVLHVDHVKPRYKHPELSLCLDNLQVLCEDCNMGKGAWDMTDWRA